MIDYDYDYDYEHEHEHEHEYEHEHEHEHEFYSAFRNPQFAIFMGVGDQVRKSSRLFWTILEAALRVAS